MDKHAPLDVVGVSPLYVQVSSVPRGGGLNTADSWQVEHPPGIPVHFGVVYCS